MVVVTAVVAEVVNSVVVVVVSVSVVVVVAVVVVSDSVVVVSSSVVLVRVSVSVVVSAVVSEETALTGFQMFMSIVSAMKEASAAARSFTLTISFFRGHPAVTLYAVSIRYPPRSEGVSEQSSSAATFTFLINSSFRLIYLRRVSAGAFYIIPHFWKYYNEVTEYFVFAIKKSPNTNSCFWQ